MADREATEPRDEESSSDPQVPRNESANPVPAAEFKMELRDSLPGDRAVIGVEQAGEFMWLASRRHMTEQAVEEFTDQLTRIVREGWWVQNWPGAR